MSKNTYDEELGVMVGIVTGLYGSDLTPSTIVEFINLEFDTNYTLIDIEDYYILKAHEDKQISLNDFTIEWADLIRA